MVAPFLISACMMKRFYKLLDYAWRAFALLIVLTGIVLFTVALIHNLLTWVI